MARRVPPIWSRSAARWKTSRIPSKRGNDRTGIVALLLLALAGVTPEAILADYVLSPDADRDGLLARQHTTTRETILATLAQLDAARYLRAGGLSQADLAAVRARLRESA